MEQLHKEKEFHRHGGAVAFTVKLANINKRFFEIIQSLVKTEEQYE